MNRNAALSITFAMMAVPALWACSESSTPTSVATETSASPLAAAKQTLLQVYKSPTCGCCGAWIEHAQHQGFATTIEHPDDLSIIKAQYGVSPRYQSCHTSVSETGFVFEGHIPARYIHQFLAQPPANAIGLAVPGMPAGSPGMEVENRFSPYEILLLNKDGSTRVYAKVASASDQ